jgi:shikimate kinase
MLSNQETKHKKIFLIGLPGSGKSTVGKALAQHLNFAWIDLDEAIEQKMGMKVAAIINTTSESYFRTIEHETFLECIEQNSFVMSCGGGTPCFFNQIEIMKNTGLVIFINPPLPDIAERLILEPEKRPLINAGDLNLIIEKLTLLLQNRMPIYSQAHLEVTDFEDLIIKI